MRIFTAISNLFYSSQHSGHNRQSGGQEQCLLLTLPGAGDSRALSSFVSTKD